MATTEEFVFVIDTNAYSGNFERDLCAYCTGAIGDCGVGKHSSEMYYEETGFEEEDNIFYECIAQRVDGLGCFRPCDVYPTPGWGNDGDGHHKKLNKSNQDKFKFPAYQSVGIFFSQKPTDEQIELIKNRAESFFQLIKNERKVAIHGFRLLIEKQIVEEVANWEA